MARDLSRISPARRPGSTTRIGPLERGRSRPGGDTLKRLADALDTTSDYLLDGASDEAAAAPQRRTRRGSVSRLEQQLDAIGRLPRAKQKIVATFLDAMLVGSQSGEVAATA